MMKGRIFRILPLLAGMALLACTTAGCSAGGKSREREETKEKETVWLTMFVENKSRYTGLQEDAVAQYIEERFGIRIKLTTDAALENSPKGAEAYKELLRTKLESNDLDDIMDFGPALTDAELLEMLQKSAKGGLLQPLDQLIGSSAPGLNEDGRISVRNDYRRDAVYEDGRLYSLGSQGGIEDFTLPDAAVWIRWDLYSEMGYPEVSNDKELLDMLKMMQCANPEISGGEKTYALGLPDKQDAETGTVLRDYMMSKGYEAFDGSCAVYFNHADQTAEALLTDPDSIFWKGAEFYYQANQMGILDPESSSMDFTEYEKKINKGLYLASLDGTQVKGKEQILAGKGLKDAGYMPLKPLDDVRTVFLRREDVLGDRELTVTKSCKYPERAMEFLGWCFTEEGARILSQGIKSLAWEERDGNYTLTEEYKKDATLGITDLAEKYGKEKYEALSGFLPLCRDSKGDYIQPEQSPKLRSGTAVEKDAAAYYKKENITGYLESTVPTEGFQEGKPETIEWHSYMKLTGSKPEEIQKKTDAIDSCMNQAVLDCIYAQNDTDFQSKKVQAIQVAEALGTKDIAAWYQKRLEELNQEVTPLLERAIAVY